MAMKFLVAILCAGAGLTLGASGADLAPKASALPEQANTAPVSVHDVQAEALPDNEFRIRFTVRNHTGQPKFIRAIPHDKRDEPVMGGKQILVSENPEGQKVELVVAILQPCYITVHCESYETNVILHW
jgi:hypothetical protein